MSLKLRALAAGRWVTFSTVIRVGFQFLQTLVLARILSPDDFGLMAVVSGFVVIAMVFADLGLSNALIHFAKPDQKTLSTLYWLNLGFAVLMMLIFFLLAWPMAHVYDNSALIELFCFAGLVFPLNAISLQFKALAEKDLRFVCLAWIEIVAALLAFVTAILFALFDFGVFSLVAGMLALTATRSILVFFFLSYGNRPKFYFKLAGVKKFVRYGSYRIGESLASTVSTQADVLIGGYFVGPAAMGVYAVPRDLSMQVANTVVNPVVTRVGLPLMAKFDQDRAALKEVYLKMLRMSSSINFPIYAMLAVFAEDVVLLILGDQWGAASLYLSLFAAWGAIRSVGNPVGSLLYATGNVSRAFWWNLILLLIVVPLLWIGAITAGQKGLAFSMLFIQVLIFFPVWRYLVRPICGATISEYLMQLIPPFVAAGTAALTSYVTLYFLDWSSPYARVTVVLVLGSLIYLIASLLVNRVWIVVMRDFFLTRSL